MPQVIHPQSTAPIFPIIICTDSIILTPNRLPQKHNKVLKLTYKIHWLSFLFLVLLCYSIPSPAQKKKQPEKKQAEKKKTEKHSKPLGPEKPVEKKVAEKKAETPADKKTTETKQPEKKQADERPTSVCNCVMMKIQAQDTLSEDTYITYTFTVKNHCKEPVWVNSSRFGFFVNNFGGGRPRVIRDLLFVKRAIYPSFVLIKPGDNFDFKFADNPFDEYILKRGNRYWFRFTYNNTPRSGSHRGKHLNYLCKKELQRLVYIR